jgi:hypothetical protein
MMVMQELDALEIERQGQLEALGFAREAEAHGEMARSSLLTGTMGGIAKATKAYGENRAESVPAARTYGPTAGIPLLNE